MTCRFVTVTFICRTHLSHSSRWFISLLFFVFSTLFLPLRVHPFEWATGRAKICFISPCSWYLGILPITSVSYHHCSHPYYDCSSDHFFVPIDFSSALRISSVPATITSELLWIPSEGIVFKLFIQGLLYYLEVSAWMSKPNGNVPVCLFSFSVYMSRCLHPRAKSILLLTEMFSLQQNALQPFGMKYSYYYNHGSKQMWFHLCSVLVRMLPRQTRVIWDWKQNSANGGWAIRFPLLPL